MKTKIYLGEPATGMQPVLKQTVRYVIEFYGNPTVSTFFNVYIQKNVESFMNFYKQFRTSDNTIYYTLREATTQQTIDSLLANLLEFNTNEDITYSLSPTNNTYGFKDIWVDVVGLASDDFTLFIATNITSAINFIAPTQINTFMGEQEVTYDDYKLLDLYEDENVELTSKLSDIEKLSNVFTDFSNSFSVPATANNNEILKHYYDVDVDNTFNANIRVNGYIEIDSFPFRFGRIQLEGVKLKNQKPDSYKITFYGAVIQLSDLFADDTIDKLDYKKNDLGELIKTWDSLSQFDFEYNSTNFNDSINNPTFKDGNVITPLISYTNRDWNYGTDNSIDISTNTGAIIDTELRQAIRIYNIIEAIETKYDVKFTRDFFSSAVFNNLFMWMNADNRDIRLGLEQTIDLIDDFTWDNMGAAPFVEDYVILDSIENWIDLYVRPLNPNPAIYFKYTIRLFVINMLDTSTSFKVYARDYYTNEIIAQSEIKTGNDASGDPSIRIFLNQRETAYNRRIKFSIETSKNNTFDVKIIVDAKYSYETPVFPYFGLASPRWQSTPNEQFMPTLTTTEKNLPKIKVIDFFQGIMKQFKLIVRPLSGNMFYLNTLNGYYADGNILNITEYVDEKDINIERPLIYKNIDFKYQKTNNVAGKKYRTNNDPINDEIGYGDLNSNYPSIESKNDLKVELPFENMLFDRMVVLAPDVNEGVLTNILIGQSISSSDGGVTFTKNNSKPILFFNNGIVSNNEFPIKVKFGDDEGTLVYPYLVGNTNDELLDQVTDTINFGAEKDPWHLSTVANSLYLNYWEDWINTIYDLKQRKFTFEANLPPRYIEELSLNDRILINNNRYKINDYKINLLNGKTQFTLFNDIFDWNPYSFEAPSLFNEFTLSPNGFFNADYIDADASTILYGSFTSYNGTSVGRVVKVLANGAIDTSFNSGTGFNLNTYAAQSVIRQSNGKLLFTGDFTSYSGVSRNRIIRLESNGSIDTSFVVGTGFNDLTSAIGLDSNSNIIVGGSFTSYSGVSRNRIIKLTSGGTVDTSFVIGTGFDSVTNDIVINADDSMYVSGYFSNYSGVSKNRLVKLTSGGTIDETFNIGAGLNSSSSEYVRLLSDGNEGVYVTGFFTTYSGITVNRMTKLNSNGQINTNFKSVSGFSSSVRTIYSVMNDKVLVAGSVAASDFGTYNGLNLKCGLVLNNDGSIYRTFNGYYKNIYANGSKFYGNLANGATQLIADETLPTLSLDSIVSNAGVKYFSVNILKNQPWTLSKLDLGYDTDWVTLLTPEGDGVGECVIRVEEKATQSAPEVYQPRYLDLLFNFDGVYRSVRIIQNGLEE